MPKVVSTGTHHPLQQEISITEEERKEIEQRDERLGHGKRSLRAHGDSLNANRRKELSFSPVPSGRQVGSNIVAQELSDLVSSVIENKAYELII